jgi:bifunctional UDP-N-acetylglucosamine pyrophosphorylase/glucosamine-1-phosphate N-acetyltransferase
MLQARPADRSCLAIILAAGEGKRMQSTRSKVLHKIAGRSMLAHVIEAVMAAEADSLLVVAAPHHADVIAEAKHLVPHAEITIQTEQLGTAHAVLTARHAIAEGYDDILILFGDTPLVSAEILQAMRAALSHEAMAVVALGFEANEPHGYGRLIFENDKLVAIIEERDASAEERKITLCNGGLMALDGHSALALLDLIHNENAQKEYYLTDIVKVAHAKNFTASALLVPEEAVMGVNDRVQLAKAESIMQKRLREKAMLNGATLLDPSSVTFSHDTKLGPDVVVEPYVVFGPGVSVAEGSTIRSFSHIEGANIGKNATIGPFARLRPGSELSENVHIGNFVELKAANIRAGAKINHLSYIGDAEIGSKTNVGAGTITCNYDGFGKYRTIIGDGCFIGSNSSLVAPLNIANGAYIGSGSVVTEDVSEDALVLARGQQIEKPGWAKKFREKNTK